MKCKQHKKTKRNNQARKQRKNKSTPGEKAIQQQQYEQIGHANKQYNKTKQQIWTQAHLKNNVGYEHEQASKKTIAKHENVTDNLKIKVATKMNLKNTKNKQTE